MLLLPFTMAALRMAALIDRLTIVYPHCSPIIICWNSPSLTKARKVCFSAGHRSSQLAKAFT